jgi:hypothetical protein
MYSITENIYCSQLSSVAILLQPETVSHRIIQGKDCVFSPVLSSFGLPLPPTCKVLTASEARSYFASIILKFLFCNHKNNAVENCDVGTTVPSVLRTLALLERTGVANSKRKSRS